MKHLDALADTFEDGLGRLFPSFDPLCWAEDVPSPPPFEWLGPRVYLYARFARHGRSETVVAEVRPGDDPGAWRLAFFRACWHATQALEGAPRPSALGGRRAAW